MAKEIEYININGETYEISKIYEKMGLSYERFVELLERDFYCPTLSAEPTSTTLTYTDTDGSTNHFQVGQSCRWLSNGAYRIAICTDVTDTASSWYILPDTSSQPMVSTTWAELKTMRDESKLVPGTWYRITDYVTTTSQANTRSAGHPFDVIVLATGANTLSEEARAARHPVDDKIVSIQLTKAGPFDFRYKGIVNVDGTDWFEFNTTIEGESASVVASVSIPSVGDAVYMYADGTIDTSEFLTVYSVSESENEYFLINKANLDAWKIWYCLDNDKTRFPWALAKQNKSITTFADNGFITAEYNGEYLHEGTVYHSWTVPHPGSELTLIFLTESGSPQVGDVIPFYGIVEMDYVENSNFYVSSASEANDNEGYGVIYRMMDEHQNDVPYDFKNVQFVRPLTNGALDLENGVNEFVFTFNYLQNDFSLSKYCFENVIRKSSSKGLNDIVFLNTSYGILDLCTSNTFGNNCYSNTFGNNCYSNTFGNACSENTFDDNCNDNTFGTSEVLASNVKGYKLLRGIRNNFLDVEGGHNYETRVAYNSNGELKMYCEADLIN